MQTIPTATEAWTATLETRQRQHQDRIKQAYDNAAKYPREMVEVAERIRKAIDGGYALASIKLNDINCTVAISNLYKELGYDIDFSDIVTSSDARYLVTLRWVPKA